MPGVYLLHEPTAVRPSPHYENDTVIISPLMRISSWTGWGGKKHETIQKIDSKTAARADFNPSIAAFGVRRK